MARSLNIFTDASIVKTDGPYETVGCAGFVSATGETGDTSLKTLDKYYNILLNTTNNISEATGVLKAVQYAVCHKNDYDEINIFSDSQWCIRSITSWIFGWIGTINPEGVMFNSSNEPVINQNIFNEIILTIVQNNTKIHFYHVKGHVKDTQESIFEALKSFRTSNFVKRNVHLNYNMIYIMSYYNNMVDEESRKIAQDFVATGNTTYPLSYPSPFFYILNREMLDIYKQLIS